MGNRSQGESSREYEQLIDQFQIIQENQNEGIRYLEHRTTKEEFLLREISCHDKQAFSKSEVIFRQKVAQLDNNRHVAPLRKLISNSQDQYCMTFYKVYALFEFPQRTLDDQINERGLQKRRFLEKELWSILASCILGLSHLQKNNIKHSTLRSSTILISSDGVIKVYDPITTGYSTNYDILLNQRSTPHIYISPEQVECLKQQKLTSESNPYKSDIWTLGMIILEAGLLAYQDQCYRDQSSRIHWQTLQYNINLFQQNYSPELTNLIEFMLGKDERSRPDWFQLEEHVIKIEEDVRGSTVNQIKQNPPNNQNQKNNKVFKPVKSLSSSRSIQPNQAPQFNAPIFNSKVGIVRSKMTEKPSQPKFQPKLDPPHSLYTQNIKPSNISHTRPLRSVFPLNSYSTTTKVDENLILMTDDQRQFDLDDDDYRYSGMEIKNSKRGVEGQKMVINNYNSFQQPVPKFNATATFQVPSYSPQSNLIYQPKPIYYESSQVNHIHTLPLQSAKQHSNIIQNNFSPTPSLQRASQGQYIIERYKQGSRYQGYKLNGQKHGFGKFYYQDGGLYEGQWCAGKMQGHGKLYYQSDRLAYQGDWHSDQFQGKGSLYNEFPEPLHGPFDYRNFDEIEQFWTKYEGQFQEDMKHGWGILYLSNGQFFEGQFKSDYAEGLGTFTTLNGGKVRGRWRSNVME